MPRVSILTELKSVYSDMYDSNNKMKVVFTGRLYSLKLSDARLQLMEGLFDLLLNTDIVCKYTQKYISTQLKVSDILNDEIAKGNSDLTLSVVNNKIQYDKCKIDRVVSVEELNDILFKPALNIESIHLRVNSLMRKHKGVGDIRSQFSLNIEEDTLLRNYYGTIPFRDEFKSVIETYCVPVMKQVEEKLNNNKLFVGYFNFLLSGIETTDQAVLNDRRWLIDKLRGINADNIKTCMDAVPSIREGVEDSKEIPDDTDKVVEKTEDKEKAEKSVEETVPIMKKTRVQF